ncbi:MAG: hypothetical protein ACO1TE_20035 [Prosthecobacter sp.]
MKRLLTLVFMVLTSTLVAQDKATLLQHHGFVINLTRIEGSEKTETVLAAVKRQIEIVETVGLAEETLKFFRSVPILLLPASTGTPGLYSKRNKRVSLKHVDLAPNKPILLHEFLHAYHDQILADGHQNADVLHFYEMALQRYRMSKSEYFLSNEKEFFAVTASIYLHGSIKRAPFDRKTIQTTQPLYWKFLEGLFGKREP